MEGQFAQIDFDFELQPAAAPVEQKRMQRVRALTQINLSDDPYLHDDFAYATRDELIAEIRFSEDANLAKEFGWCRGGRRWPVRM